MSKFRLTIERDNNNPVVLETEDSEDVTTFLEGWEGNICEYSKHGEHNLCTCAGRPECHDCGKSL